MEQEGCQQIRERLHAYRAGELSPLARVRVEAHLAHCKLCAAEDWLHGELHGAAQVGPEPLSAERKRAILDQVHQQIGDAPARSATPADPQPRWPWWLPSLAAPAAVAAAALVLFVLTRPEPLPVQQGWIATGMGVQAYAPHPARVLFEDRDGTPVLHLDSQALLIKFDRPAGVGPLEVRTPHATAVVRGTIFFADVHEARSSVGVQHGRVEVIGDSGQSLFVTVSEQVSAYDDRVVRDTELSPYFDELRALFPPPPEPEPEPEPEPRIEARPPIVAPAPWQPDPEAIYRAVSKRIYTVRECYQHAIKHGETAEGRMELEVRYGAEGQVIDAQVKSDELGLEEVRACVLERVLRWRFPPPDAGEVSVVIPFTFTPTLQQVAQ